MPGGFFSFQVKLGPTFIFVVQGTAVEPCLEFSFTKFNFGKCFLYSPGMVPACQTLVMSNKGAKGIRYLLLSLCCFLDVQSRVRCAQRNTYNKSTTENVTRVFTPSVSRASSRKTLSSKSTSSQILCPLVVWWRYRSASTPGSCAITTRKSLSSSTAALQRTWTYSAKA